MEELNIRNFKLINGDNIIALVSSNNEHNYMLERPVAVYSTMVGGYQFAPWFPFSDQKRYTLDKSTIIGDSGVVETIKKEYVKYALSASKAFEPPESQESIVNRITEEIFNRFDTEVEDDYHSESPEPSDIIH